MENFADKKRSTPTYRIYAHAKNEETGQEYALKNMPILVGRIPVAGDVVATPDGELHVDKVVLFYDGLYADSDAEIYGKLKQNY